MILAGTGLQMPAAKFETRTGSMPSRNTFSAETAKGALSIPLS